MALAGPVTNFAIAAVAALLMHIGIAAHIFVPVGGLAVTSLHGGLLEGLGQFVSVLLQLNILLGVFNLLPFPPLDGYSVLGLVLPERAFLKFLEFVRSPGFSLIGLLIALQVLPHLIVPVMQMAARVINLAQM
jgi:Zn-dependent protease